MDADSFPTIESTVTPADYRDLCLDRLRSVVATHRKLGVHLPTADARRSLITWAMASFYEDCVRAGVARPAQRLLVGSLA